MDINYQHKLMECQLQKRQRILLSVRQLKLLAACVVFFTIAVAFFRPVSSTRIFISFLVFLIIQVFATREYAALLQTARREKLMLRGQYFPAGDTKIPWKIAAGAAVKDGFFILLIFFDLSWLMHAYLYPAPADSFFQFREQLVIGMISGWFFIWFTILLWLVYLYLFVTGILYAEEMNEIVLDINGVPANTGEVWIRVKTYNGTEIYLEGEHLSNAGQQPLILFPGFFQNGHVFDLTPNASLAAYLRENGFDVWIIHPRGTARSEGRHETTSLDDFASDDIPAMIHYVFLKTGIKPVFIGHSQGGISAAISMMGALKRNNGTVVLSDAKRDERQHELRALVTIGSFLDFSFSKTSWLKDFVDKGLQIRMGGIKKSLVSSQTLLALTSKLGFVATPFSYQLRMALTQSKRLRILLFPVTLILNFFSQLKLWEFLYHIPNLDGAARKNLFYKTMDGTFSQILQQYWSAVSTGGMRSGNGRVNYSMHYHRIELPVSIVAMELDTLADPVMMKQKMFDVISSEHKYFTVWPGVGHEDHFTNTCYFKQVLDAVRKVC